MIGVSFPSVKLWCTHNATIIPPFIIFVWISITNSPVFESKFTMLNTYLVCSIPLGRKVMGSVGHGILDQMGLLAPIWLSALPFSDILWITSKIMNDCLGIECLLWQQRYGLQLPRYLIHLLKCFRSKTLKSNFYVTSNRVAASNPPYHDLGQSETVSGIYTYRSTFQILEQKKSVSGNNPLRL